MSDCITLNVSTGVANFVIGYKSSSMCTYCSSFENVAFFPPYIYILWWQCWKMYSFVPIVSFNICNMLQPTGGRVATKQILEVIVVCNKGTWWIQKKNMIYLFKLKVASWWIQNAFYADLFRVMLVDSVFFFKYLKESSILKLKSKIRSSSPALCGKLHRAI